jgi:DNA-binding beta-propeller fold protein YncE
VDNQGRILVVDATGHGMLGYDQKGKLLFALGGLGKSEGRFYFPKSVATDKNGRIYVVEPFLGRVQVLNVETL